MRFNGYRTRLALRILLLFATSAATAWLLTHGAGWYAVLVAPVVGWLVIDFYQAHAALQTELEEFTAAVRYQDFSRRFNPHQTKPELGMLRTTFNEINAAFKSLSREKETQYHHLQSILELITTGILSYDMGSGQVGWLNEALKQQLRLPHLKNISGLARRYPALAAQLQELHPAAPLVVTVRRGTDEIRVLLAATVFQTDGRQYKLIAFQNVGDTLDETEAQAWQKLLRVLTHEIMNSVAPIASLADTMQRRLATTAPPDADMIDDLTLGINTIKKRSAGLLQFATTYRSLSQIAVPNVAPVPVYELFEAVHHLMQPTLDERGVTLDILLPDPNLQLLVDQVLFEQVLINLVINALDAVRDTPQPRITLAAAPASDGNHKATLTVTDNGVGIAPDVLDKVYVPFFTTKKNGSGIGLSLCKQILLLHKGSMQIRSEPGRGTVVTLRC